MNLEKAVNHGGHGEKQKQKQVFGFSPGSKWRRG
jgi:hypothetical protein